MSLIDEIMQDVKNITSDKDEFGVEIVFVAPSGETATIAGLHSKHTLSYDADAQRVNHKNTHISSSESLLIAANYPVRINGIVSLIGHKITVKDSTGIAKTQQVSEQFPDETIGLILCYLKDYE